MNNEYDLIFHLHNELIDAYNVNMYLTNQINKLKEDKKKIRNMLNHLIITFRKIIFLNYWN